MKTAMVRGLKAVVAEGPLADTPVVKVIEDEDGDEVTLEEAFRTTLSEVMKAAVARSLEDAPVDGAGPALPIELAWGLASAADSPRDEVWLACVAGPSIPLCRELQLTPGRDVVFKGGRAMVLDGATWIMAQRVPAAEAPALADRLGSPLGRPGAAAAPSVHEVDLGLGDGTDRRGKGRGSGAAASEDLRTLWIDWDNQGERFKAWREVCRESTSEDLDEQRFEGSATALHMCKAMERQGGDPRSWLERWLREKRLDASERVAHELRCLTDALYLAGTVDQLNLGALHCVETLSRRIAAIVEAYTTPGRPSWEHARFYAGTASSEEVVSPSLRAQVLRRAKDESDIANVRARVLRGSGGSEDTAAGTAAGGAGSRGAGRGRGKGGRGDPPPAGS